MNAVYKWINLVAFVAMVVINALANIIPFGGNTTGQVSGSTPTLFTPAAYTFSIWGVIYIFMGIFVAYQFIIPVESDAYESVAKSVGLLFLLSCLLNIAWIFLWHNKMFGTSVLCILLLLMTLCIINTRFNIDPSFGIGHRLSVYGFNIYIGWICAATIANISVFLADLNWNRFGLSDQFWMIVVLIVGAFLGIAFTLSQHRFMASLAIVWAYLGILVKHASASGYDGSYPAIMIVTCCSIIGILTFVIITSILPTFQMARQY